MNVPTNDHVFRETGDGRLALVGDFDGLYRAEDDPWEQSGRGGRAAYYAASRHNLLASLARHTPRIGSCLEIGCGHGHLTAQLDRTIGQAVGMDISAAAIEQARRLHPKLSFLPGDITAADFVAPGRFDCVILAQCWWYVLHWAERAVANALACVKPGGILAVSQAMLTEQRYGRDIADGFTGMIRLLISRPGVDLVECACRDEPPFLDGLAVLRRAPLRQAQGEARSC